MRTLHGWMFLLLVLVYFSEVDSYGDYHYEDTNFCTRVEWFEKSYVIPKTKRIKEKYTTWCLKIPPKCTRERVKFIHTNETVTVNASRTVYECCKGFKLEDDICIPECEHGCFHGECIGPDDCFCDAGWSGPLCDEECEPNRYGKGCELNCTCLNGGTCDKVDGSCSCAEGFNGTYCEIPCPHNYYGKHCKEECLCENGAHCDNRNGKCKCQPGYSGEYCEQRCEPGYHGQDCNYDCVCIPENTHSCDHVDGKCVCMAGYTGQFCERECDNFTYGNDCQSKCECINGEYCDPITGVCYCKPGWTSKTCSEKCMPGKFGENCMYKCAKCPSCNHVNGSCASCNHVTGYCDCPPGTFGTLCDSDCLEGYWGTNCTNKCKCINRELCNVTTGECTCPTGFIQPNCSETCDLGWYGDNCSSACNCSNENSCNPKTGICFASFPLQNEAIAKGGVFMWSMIAALVGIFIIIVLLVFNYRTTISSMSRSFLRRDTMESNSTKRVIDKSITKPTNFSNPLYGNPDFRIHQSMTADAVEQAFTTSPDNGWKSVDLNLGNKGANEEGSENVNATSAEGSEIKRNSKRLSDKKSTPSDASDFAPEILTEFKIPEDDTNDTVKSACRKVISGDMEAPSTNA